MPSRSITRRTVLQLIAGQALATSVASAKPAMRPKNPPNVVFVLADDVGYGDFACLGNPYIKTPNIDRLHGSSVRFTDFHVSPTCSPSRSALMTGKYCDSVGVWHTIMGRSILQPGVATLADCFRSSGYRTGLFGKWHLGDNYPSRAQDRGFEEVVVCGGGGIWQTPDYFGNDDRNDSYRHNGRFEKYEGFSTHVFFDQSMKFMAGAQDAGQPFFCYIPTTASHIPTWALDEDTRPYEHVPGLTQPGFYGMTVEIDADVGRLLQFLDRRGLRENTILIFASDNGGADGVKVFNAGMRGEKGSAYEGGHRVPLFVEWRGGAIGGGRDVNVLSKDIDLLPTLVDLCGLTNRGTQPDGQSLRPLLQQRTAQTAAAWPDRTLFVDSQRDELLVRWRQTAVMTQQWRLVNPGLDGDPAKIELYDIKQDPGQQSNIAGQHPEVVAALSKKYDAWWATIAPQNERMVHIVLGNDRDNPACLTSMDWHSPDALNAWHQRQILTGPVANGFWAVDIARPGRYRFELRRWPREIDAAINAAYRNPPDNKEQTPGVSIGATSGSINIAGQHQSQPVDDDAKFLAFTLNLPAGPAELRTAFACKDQHERGAYYVYVERLAG
ncbi:MAG: arylsulfatase [Acidobacteriaceae bacterium]